MAERKQQVFRKIIPDRIRNSVYQYRRQAVLSCRKNSAYLLDRSVRNMAPRLLELKNAYQMERCFIMGNGPSLNKMDLSLFKGEYIWGSNRCYLLFDRIAWRPKFYVAVDKRVVPDNASEINALYRILPGTNFFFPVQFRYNRILHSADNLFWFSEVPLSEDNMPYSMFSTDPSEFVYVVRTVTITMLQIAVYLGFNPIYLIGCDTSYSIPASIQHENDDQNLLVSTEDDPNHFSPSYFGKDKKWHFPHVDGMIFHYQQAKQVCDELGSKVYNATVGGKLEVFPRVNYEDLF